jgi:hypothetical protein
VRYVRACIVLCTLHTWLDLLLLPCSSGALLESLSIRLHHALVLWLFKAGLCTSAPAN